MAQNLIYPGGSKSRVDLAGKNVRDNKFTDEDLDVIDQWREAHRIVLNTFQAILRMRTRYKIPLLLHNAIKEDLLFLIS